MIKLPPVNLLALLPVVIPTITGLLMLCWDLGMKDEERHRLAWLGIFGLAVTAVVSFCLLGRNELAFNGSLALDGYAMFFNLVFCLAGILTLLMSANYLQTVDIHAGEYYSLILFAIVGMMLMAAAADLINIFLGLETMSMAVYVLTGIWRQRLKSNGCTQVSSWRLRQRVFAVWNRLGLWRYWRYSSARSLNM
jgi:NADH-quinone oxidoreductase subunit N